MLPQRHLRCHDGARGTEADFNLTFPLIFMLSEPKNTPLITCYCHFPARRATGCRPASQLNACWDPLELPCAGRLNERKNEWTPPGVFGRGGRQKPRNTSSVKYSRSHRSIQAKYKRKIISLFGYRAAATDSIILTCLSTFLTFPFMTLTAF